MNRRLTRQLAPVVMSLGVALTSGMTACGSDITNPRDERNALLWLALDSRAITLSTVAPHKTFQLSAIAYRGTGEAIGGVTPLYESTSDNISVTPEGLVTAVRSSTQPALVVATLQYNGVTRLDSAYVLVTDVVNPVPFATLSISIGPLAAGTGDVLTTVIQDQNGASLQVPVSYRSSDRTVAEVDGSGYISANIPDEPVTIIAKTTVYGVTLTDSVNITIGYPALGSLNIEQYFTGPGTVGYRFPLQDIYISVNGIITFVNFIDNEPNYLFKLDVTFDDPTAVVATDPSPLPFPTGNGNIPPFGSSGPTDPLSNFQRRKFPRVGTFTFHSERLNSGGRIHVR